MINDAEVVFKSTALIPSCYDAAFTLHQICIKELNSKAKELGITLDRVVICVELDSDLGLKPRKTTNQYDLSIVKQGDKYVGIYINSCETKSND